MHKVVSFFPDLLLIAGFASVSYGCWLAFPPAGFIVGGLLSFAAGLQMVRAG
jgi:hypothetical protein